MVTCVICGTEFYQGEFERICMFTGYHRCESKDCYQKAYEYSEKKIKIMADFANEKTKLLTPLKEKLDMDLFLLDRGYLKK